ACSSKNSRRISIRPGRVGANPIMRCDWRRSAMPPSEVMASNELDNLHANISSPIAIRIARHWARLGKPRPGPFAFLGPGLITGASDDDPSGIATYSQVGAQFGFGMSWVMLFSFPLMAAIQEVSARIGRVTGEGIAGNIRRHYSPGLLYGLVGCLMVANIINLGADLGAMGDALVLMIGGPGFLYVVLFGAVCAGLEIFIS